MNYLHLGQRVKKISAGFLEKLARSISLLHDRSVNRFSPSFPSLATRRMYCKRETPHFVCVVRLVLFRVVARIASVSSFLLDGVNLLRELAVTRYDNLLILERNVEVNRQRFLHLADKSDAFNTQAELAAQILRQVHTYSVLVDAQPLEALGPFEHPAQELFLVLKLRPVKLLAVSVVQVVLDTLEDNRGLRQVATGF